MSLTTSSSLTGLTQVGNHLSFSSLRGRAHVYTHLRKRTIKYKLNHFSGIFDDSVFSLILQASNL